MAQEKKNRHIDSEIFFPPSPCRYEDSDEEETLRPKANLPQRAEVGSSNSNGVWTTTTGTQDVQSTGGWKADHTELSESHRPWNPAELPVVGGFRTGSRIEPGKRTDTDASNDGDQKQRTLSHASAWNNSVLRGPKDTADGESFEPSAKTENGGWGVLDNQGVDLDTPPSHPPPPPPAQASEQTFSSHNSISSHFTIF